MTSRDFCFWLQGVLELRGNTATITAEQADCIQKHLALVFVHEIDPSAGPAEHQAKLNEVHSPPIKKSDLEHLLKPSFPSESVVLRC